MEDPMVAMTLIKENMEVLGSDGIHVGFVEYMKGADVVRLPQKTIRTRAANPTKFRSPGSSTWK